MSNSPLVSVVVPVYNTSEYLDECISSLINQTLHDIELIFVDDGSTDNSVEIIEKYQKNDDRIKLYKQKNQFAGVARNNGMEHATGKYIIFFDSDDYVELSALEELYNKAEDSNAQIVVFGIKSIDNVTKDICTAYTPQLSGLVNSHKNIIEISDSYWGVPYNKFYLRSYIMETGLKYQSVRNSNDEFFVNMSIYLADSVLVISNCYYYYRTNNSNSLQGSKLSYKPCFGEFLVSMKEEMIRRGIYHDDYVTSFWNKVQRAITPERFFRINSLEKIKEHYDYCKYGVLNKIILDESELNYLKPDSIAYIIYNCNDFNEFMCQLYFLTIESTKKMAARKDNEIQYLYGIIDKFNNDYISKRSLAYRIGSVIIYIPRKIKELLK